MSAAAATRGEIARLFGRAAFGATAADLDRWTGRPYGEAVESLLAVPTGSARPPQVDEEQRLTLEQSGRTGQTNTQVEPVARQAQQWWLERMRSTPYPLEERMTLCWHNHFATSYQVPYPDVAMMVVQNQTIRKNALGNFRTLVDEVTLDPAMLQWLDGARNATPRPNENYGRELLELFTLGKQPQIYSEDDVQEAARALTGWTLDNTARSVSFAPARHDKGTKRVLGATITNSGEQEYKVLVDLALAQPVSARFIASKLVANFAYVPPGRDLLADADPLVVKVADQLRATDWDVRSAMRTLLTADEFREPTSGERRLVRQPVELVVAACKGFSNSPKDDKVTDVLARMGQRLFAPINVGGWPSGTNWISPPTTIARYDWGVLTYQLWAAQATATRAPLPPSGDLGAWAARIGLSSVSPTTEAAVSTYLGSRITATEAERQAGVLVLLLSSPDWMVL